MWTWQLASDYLKGGRKKYIRPLYDRGLYVSKVNRWDPDSDIAINYKNPYSEPFITYHKDGSITLKSMSFSQYTNWKPATNYSVRYTIERYAGVRVFQRNFKIYIVEKDPKLSPPKIQGCRTCSQTGRVDGYCYSHTCYGSSQVSDGKWECTEHNYEGRSRFHTVPCEHGLDQGHNVKRLNICFTCGGTKKHDYGSKPEKILWNGQPIRFLNGKLIQSTNINSPLERMMADVVESVSIS